MCYYSPFFHQVYFRTTPADLTFSSFCRHTGAFVLEPILPSISSRGLPTFPSADCCVRLGPRDYTMGFFLCCFVRSESAEGATRQVRLAAAESRLRRSTSSCEENEDTRGDEQGQTTQQRQRVTEVAGPASTSKSGTARTSRRGFLGGYWRRWGRRNQGSRLWGPLVLSFPRDWEMRSSTPEEYDILESGNAMTL